jgi:hypothetical protein
LISIGTPGVAQVAHAVEDAIELAAHAHAAERRDRGAVEAHLDRLDAELLQAGGIRAIEVVGVGLDLELGAALAGALDHREEMRVEHRLAARERQVGNLAVEQLVEDGEDLVAVELVGERLARPALLDAVQAGEVALVGDLPGDVERRGEILRLSGSRSGHRVIPRSGRAGAARRGRPRPRARSRRPGRRSGP